MPVAIELVLANNLVVGSRIIDVKENVSVVVFRETAIRDDLLRISPTNMRDHTNRREDMKVISVNVA